MTKNLLSKRLDLSAAPSAVALIVGMTLTLIGADASAQQQVSSRQAAKVMAPTGNLAELEKAFWICDHAATMHGVDGGMGIACGAITNDLKIKKFNGDFDSMVVWWRQNKASQHQSLTTTGYAVAIR